ncbi:MAG: immunoglobulin-like domain-containing protein [Gammaproteobacteria bacterium]
MKTMNRADWRRITRAFPSRALFPGTLLIMLSACGGGGSSSENPQPDPPADAVAPTIQLLGFASIEIVLDTTYADPGATASDNLDGDLTSQILTSIDVNTAVAGEYVVSYDVSDAANNLAATVTRVVTVVAPTAVKAQYGPAGFIKIESGLNGFADIIDNGDRFSRDHDIAGDIDGDGVTDLIVGARSDDDGATDAGAIYVLLMNSDGSVKAHQKISNLEGGFTDVLVEGNFFGYGVAGIGDYDGDGIPDVAATAPNAANRALYILHLNANGTLKSMVKNPGIPGNGLSSAGDLDGDGRIDLIAAEPGAAGGGAIHLLFLDANSMVDPARTVVIGVNTSGFGSGLIAGDEFGGRESAVLGDIDGDGTLELAVGAFQTNGGDGAVWILSLDPINFDVVQSVKIAPGESGFDEQIPNDTNPNGTTGGQFGHALAAVGDLNGDGVVDLVTGANQYAEGNAYILYLNADKTVKTFTRINDSEGGFDLSLAAEERFSRSMSSAGDITGSGTLVLNVGGGASGADGADASGTLYQLALQQCDFEFQGANMFWEGAAALFSNWNHDAQLVTGPLSFEDCTTRAFETGGNFVTYNGIDGRCIVHESATLAQSAEGSTAYLRQCP